MLSKIITGTLMGIKAFQVNVETDMLPGLPSLTTVGLPDTTVREARERIRSAVINSGYSFPAKRITVNLSPANTKKEGSHFDLPIAVGILCAMGVIPQQEAVKSAFLGELSLDGAINRIDGALPLAAGLAECGIKSLVLPEENVEEASLVKGLDLYPVKNLKEVISYFESSSKRKSYTSGKYTQKYRAHHGVDYSDVVGQENAKRAVTVCCAGSHGLLLMGEPGCGKSMIAGRIPTILPDMSYEECLEVTTIYSIGGRLSKEVPFITERPFRSPHHTISGTGLIGGGGKPIPGEISFAHRGVLFLDEICEFSKKNLDMLRQPLEENKVSVVRVSGNYVFPCNVMLVAAGNPCPCGYYGSRQHICTCSITKIQNYKNRLSGPLLDRIDLHIELQPIQYKYLQNRGESDLDSSSMRAQVNQARDKQKKRYEGTGILFNSQLTPQLMKEYCPLDKECQSLMETAFQKMGLSARAYDKVIKVSRTIADLEDSEEIKSSHLAEALRYRLSDSSH